MAYDGLPGASARSRRHQGSEELTRQAEDLANLMDVYQMWAHKMFPKGDFAHTIQRVEVMCRGRRMNVGFAITSWTLVALRSGGIAGKRARRRWTSAEARLDPARIHSRTRIGSDPYKANVANVRKLTDIVRAERLPRSLLPTSQIALSSGSLPLRFACSIRGRGRGRGRGRQLSALSSSYAGSVQ